MTSGIAQCAMWVATSHAACMGGTVPSTSWTLPNRFCNDGCSPQRHVQCVRGHGLTSHGHQLGKCLPRGPFSTAGGQERSTRQTSVLLKVHPGVIPADCGLVGLDQERLVRKQ